MANAAVLAVEVRAEADKAAAELESFGASAKAMAADVDKASRDAQRAASRLDSVGESADNLDSKASQATGSLGALASGFELVGAEQFSGQLQQAAMATDFLSGVGSGLNLILQSQALVTARAKAATIASTVATRAAAAGQWLLNAALSANPLGLLIAGVIAAVALFVILYKRSDRFRSLVQAVGRAGQAALGWIVDVSSDLVGWVRDKLPGAFSAMQSLVVGYIRLVTTPYRALFNIGKDIYSWVRDKLPAAFTTLRDKASSIADTLLAPFKGLKDLIDDVLDLIGKIKLPDIDIPGLGRTDGSATSSSRSVTTLAPASSTTVNITVTGALDANESARQIRQLLARYDTRFGVL